MPTPFPSISNLNPSPNNNPPPLTLHHPLLRALASYRHHPSLSPSPLAQLLAQLLVSNLLPHPPAAAAPNSLLRSLLSLRLPSAALSLYRHLLLPSSLPPDHLTFPLLLKTFSLLRLPLNTKATHALALKLGFSSDLFVRNSLIRAYAHAPPDARNLFDETTAPDVVTWNSMISGRVREGDMDGAKELFWMMPERDVVSWNAMVDGFGRIGEVSVARELFDGMPRRSLVSWNVMLAAYARVGEYAECLGLFDLMMGGGGVRPDKATFVSVLTACANLGQLGRGRWVHSVISEGGIEPDVLLLTCLVTMYGKCGAIESAREVFDGMAERSAVSWNSMIVSYGLHGRADKAVEMFLEMEKSGLKPNETTFVCVLSACCQSGLVLEGWWCFDHMVRVYGIKPKVEHVGCMVDLLGRSGLLKDATEFVKELTEKPALYGALMSSCWTHSNWEVGKFVGKKLIEMMPGEVGPYVLLSNIWAAEGKWEEVDKVRVMIEERGLRKGAGVSLVELDNVTVDSLSHDKGLGYNSKRRIVYSMLREMGGHLKVSWTEVNASKQCLSSETLVLPK